MHRPETPYRVVINEAVELAKAYGGTDGHRFVNGVLDKLAARVRAPEIAALARERDAARRNPSGSSDCDRGASRGRSARVPL